MSSSGGASENNYSTEEQRIGTWIDGKPLYRKVYKFDITATSTRQQIVFDKGFATNKILKNIGGNVISKDYSGFQFHLGLFNWHNSTNQFFMFLPCVDNNDLKLEVQWSVTQDFIVEAVIEYTKLTD